MRISAVAVALSGLVLAMAAGAAAPSPPARQESSPAPEKPSLRQLLRDFYRNGASPPPRQLSPVERAELRRQLSEHGRTHSRRH